MTEKEFLKSLTATVEQNAPSFIIYSPDITERLKYSCDFIFRQLLRVHHHITSDEAVFEHSPLFKINYSSDEISYAFQILPSGLLLEKGIGPKRPPLAQRNRLLYLFPVPGDAHFHFDIFSAVFFLISRYEEWQDFEPDRHQRFELKQSILFRSGHHLTPVVEHWAEEFKAALKKRFELLTFPDRKFQCIPSMDVDNLYAYRHKGFLRTAGASFRDFIKADWKNLSRRSMVLKGKQKDPFDIYESFQDFCNEHQLSVLYFFLIRTGNKFDRSVDPASGAFEPVIAMLRAKGGMTALHPSYFSGEQGGLLTEEIQTFTNLQKFPVVFSRQHYLRFNIRTTPKLLVKNGVHADFSMGFATGAGFRAGTTQPFHYYDFESESVSALLFIPFCAMDGAYYVYSNRSPAQAMQELLTLKNEIRRLNGNFVIVFHERSFAGHLYPGFGDMLRQVLLAG